MPDRTTIGIWIFMTLHLYFMAAWVWSFLGQSHYKEDVKGLALSQTKSLHDRLKYYENRDPGPHFSMKMETRGPQFGGSLFSYDTGTVGACALYLCSGTTVTLQCYHAGDSTQQLYGTCAIIWLLSEISCMLHDGIHCMINLHKYCICYKSPLRECL